MLNNINIPINILYNGDKRLTEYTVPISLADVLIKAFTTINGTYY